MASISDDPNGRRRIQFVAPDGNRKAIRLGKIDRKSAKSICRHVEALLSAKVGGQTIARDTAAWLSALGDALKAKLAAVGLVDAPKRAILGEFLRGYILSRPDVKPATLQVWQQPCRNLIDFFATTSRYRASLRATATNSGLGCSPRNWPRRPSLNDCPSRGRFSTSPASTSWSTRTRSPK